MADSSTGNGYPDTAAANLAGATAKLNAMHLAASPAVTFGERASTRTGLVWGYYGGRLSIDGTSTGIADGTVTLTASVANYVEATRAGVVSSNTTGFTAGRVPLYTVTPGGSSIATWVDNRASWLPLVNNILQRATGISVTTADVTLSAAQARCNAFATTGTLTGNRSVIVPDGPQRFVVTNGCSGAFTLTVKTASGTGVVIAAGATNEVISDGTNVVAVTGAAAAVGNPTESFVIAASDETTALAAGTAKLTFRMPYAFTLGAVRASLTTAQASGSIFTVDINESGTSVLSTKLTIDNTEKTSTTAATAAVISDASIADDAEITIDIDQIGDGTAKGLKVVLIGTRT